MVNFEEIREKLAETFDGEDDLGVVVRSHLIIESMLDSYVKSKLFDVKYYRKMKLTFEQKKDMAIALGFDNRFESAIKTLSSIRNRYAHNFTSDISKSDVNNLYKSFSEVDKKIMNEMFLCRETTNSEIVKRGLSEQPIKTKFALYVSCLCAAIYAFNHTSFEVTE